MVDDNLTDVVHRAATDRVIQGIEIDAGFSSITGIRELSRVQITSLS